MKKKWMAIVFFAVIFCLLFVVAHAEDSILKEREIFYSNTKKDAECSIWIDNEHKDNGVFVNSGIQMHSDGYAMKIKYNGVGKSGVQLIHPDDAVCDISSYKENAYLSFWMYIETNSTVENHAGNLSVCLRSGKDTNYALTGYYYLSSDIKAGSWQHILISVDEMGIDTSRGEIDFSKIYRIDLKRTSSIEEDWNVYVQDICFYEKIYAPTVTVSESGMDTDNGMFYSKLQFSNAMNKDTLAIDQFTLQGISCSAVDYDEDTKSCFLWFNTMPMRKTELALLLGDKIKDKDGLAPQIKEYTVQLSARQEEVAVTIATAPSITNGILNCSATVRRIYAPEAGNVTAVTILYSDDCPVAYSTTEFGKMGWKDELEDKIISLEIPKIDEIGKLRAEIYFIDDEATGRPLAKVLQYEL